MAEAQPTTEKTMTPMDEFANDLYQSLNPVFSTAMELAYWAKHFNWGERLADEKVISTAGIVRAFKEVGRYDFMPDNMKLHNGRNQPLPIGFGQTISQPSTVGNMLEWLRPRKGHKILDFGSGSGWTTALLGKIVGKSGSVLGVERVPELVKSGQANLAKYDLPSADIVQATDKLGMYDKAPFHRILVSAHMPGVWLEELQHQLSPLHGRLVAPIVEDSDYGSRANNCTMMSVTRHGNNFHTEKLAEGYGFVPAIYEGDDRFNITVS